MCGDGVGVDSLCGDNSNLACAARIAAQPRLADVDKPPLCVWHLKVKRCSVQLHERLKVRYRWSRNIRFALLNAYRIPVGVWAGGWMGELVVGG